MALPNGLVENVYGPAEGRRHDRGMLAYLLQHLERFSFVLAGNPMCIYGEPACISIKNTFARSF